MAKSKLLTHYVVAPVILVGILAIMAASAVLLPRALTLAKTGHGGTPRTAAILDVPLPKNIYCVIEAYRERSECTQYYQPPECSPAIIPVHDKNGISYPSQCWAEKFGATDVTPGYSERTAQFIRDLWYSVREELHYAYQTKKSTILPKSYSVPHPSIGFWFDGKGGPMSPILRSTIFDPPHLFTLEYYSRGDYQSYGVRFQHGTEDERLYGKKLKTLMVFILFDPIYPENILRQWAKQYIALLNTALQEKQHILSPTQLDATIAAIAPPKEAKRLSESHGSFDGWELNKIGNAAMDKTGRRKFQLFITVPVIQGESLGAYAHHGSKAASFSLNEIAGAEAGLYSPLSYFDPKKGIHALGMLDYTAIDHEFAHLLGWDHFPSAVYWNNNPVTGDMLSLEPCDAYALSEYFYTFPLPPGQKIFVGKEPEWLQKYESATGPCLESKNSNPGVFKDANRDGEYELVLQQPLTMIDKNWQQILGWSDIDGDGIPERKDRTPYGGYKAVTHTSYRNIAGVLKNREAVALATDPFAKLAFEPLEEVEQGKCQYQKVRLKNDEIGYVPLRCPEFNDAIVNIYRNVDYQWTKIQKKFGTILIPHSAHFYIFQELLKNQ